MGEDTGFQINLLNIYQLIVSAYAYTFTQAFNENKTEKLLSSRF